VLGHWWPVHHGIASSTPPASVPTAAVTEARLMTDEYFVGAEGVPVRASRWRAGDPLPGRRLHQLAGIWHALNAVRGAYLADRKPFLF
jgi:hypothetical protein